MCLNSREWIAYSKKVQTSLPGTLAHEILSLRKLRPPVKLIQICEMTGMGRIATQPLAGTRDPEKMVVVAGAS
jgi:hypothetical protein